MEITESPGEDHGFHLFNPTSDHAMAMLKRIVSFMNQERDKFTNDEKEETRTSFTKL